MTLVDLSPVGLGRALRLTDSPEVLQALRAAMPGWPLQARPARGLAPPIRLRRESGGEGYRQTSPALPCGLRLPSAASAACSLVADLVGAYCDRHPEMIGLHCGAVEIAGRLVIFPASHKAGKSTLTAAFAAAGRRVFGDDVLALTPEGEGMALGIAPRLRLPLPEVLAPELRAFAERHAGPEDDRYRYLALPETLLAPHGERRPLGALVLLERDDGVARPEPIELAPGEGLLQLLCQNFAHDRPSEALMARFLPLMERLPCVLLRYGEPLAAVHRLIDRFSDSGTTFAVAASPIGHRAGPESRPEVSASIAPDHRWSIRQGIREYPLDDELFLIESTSGAIHRLNASGRLVWRLLREEALGAGELAALLSEHFGVARERVARDLAALLAGLATAGLIAPADP